MFIKSNVYNNEILWTVKKILIDTIIIMLRKKL